VVKAARASLAARLHDLRTLEGWTQADVALRMNFSRATVARAERSGECSRDFLARADRLYGTEDGELAMAHDRIEALRAGALAHSTRRARERGGLTTAQEEATVAYAALDSSCPHCHKPVAVVLEQTAALVTVETATRP
jgi:transcriptional regulator with XRE-family HTH domain